MKRKIFLVALMIAILGCLFAVGVSAASFTSDFTAEVTKFYDGETELTPEWVDLDDKDATAVLKKADGTYVRVPLYYIYQEKGTEFLGDIRDESNQNSSGFRYAWISEMLGETVNHANLVSLEIPQGTQTIKSQFSGASTIYSALEELIIPTSVTSLAQSLFRNNVVLRRVFVKQTKDLEGNVQGVTSLPGWFADNTNGTVSALEEFNFELDYVTSIGSNAFMNSGLKWFRAEAPITSLGGTIFCGCKFLETVYIDNTSGTTVSIGGKTFASCTNIKSVTLNGFSLTDYLFENANGLTGGLTFKATNVTTIGTMPFKNSTNLEHVEISGPLTSIGNSFALGCVNLSTVKITNTLDTPVSGGNNMFENLTKLTSVTMSGISIGNYAFRISNGYSGEGDLKITATNVDSIGTEAFFRADYATEIYISGPFTAVSSGNVFRDCNKLKKLTVINTSDTYFDFPNAELNPMLEELHIEGRFDLGDLNSGGRPIFQANASLKNVYLGTGVRNIGQKVFYICYALEKVYLADTVAIIGDRAFDMEKDNVQTSESFMFVDENGNMDNTLPTSLTTIGGHFLKKIKIANTELIFPEGFTNHNSSQAYDFEGTTYPEGFRLIYLGKMTYVNLLMLKNSDITVYLTKNSSSDLANERVNIYVDGTTISDNGGVYAGVNASGTLYIATGETSNNNTPNGIMTAEIKYYFCGSDEVCFLTRRNIAKGEGATVEWYNFVSMPVTYAQLEAAGVSFDKHPLLSAPEFFEATCTEDGGTKIFCLGCGQLASIEKTQDAIGHNYDYENNEDAKLVSYIYENYLENGTKTVSCANCGEHKDFAVPALFVCIGYSAPENASTTSFAVKYSVNSDAIVEYEKNTGKTVSYGLFAVAQEKLGDNDILNEDGTPTDGAVKAEIPDNKFVMLELKMTGFSDEQKDFKLALGVYVTVDYNGTRTHSYLNSVKPKDGEKYAFVSYNDVVELTKKS